MPDTDHAQLRQPMKMLITKHVLLQLIHHQIYPMQKASNIISPQHQKQPTPYTA
jgi:hypothetical protein